MTIDETIQKYKKSSEFYKDTTNYRNSIELEQIVEWLEELKCYRNENNFSEYADRLYKNAYNKALDDIKTKIDDEYCDGGYGDYHEVEMIVRMIEQLRK